MAKDTCSSCGKKLGLFEFKKIIRCKPYCRDCARSIPTCDKCKWHFRSDLYDYGVCHYHQQWLQDYDNICAAYETGPQVRIHRCDGCGRYRDGYIVLRAEGDPYHS